MTVRVVHVLEALEGGTARHLVDIARHATRSTHLVIVPPRRVGGMTDETAIGKLREAGADVRLVPMRRTPWRPGNAAALMRIRRILRSSPHDVVHTHSSIGGFLGRLAAARLGRPVVYTPNGITDVAAGVLVERMLGRVTDRLIATSESEAERTVGLRIVPPSRIIVIANGIEPDLPERIDIRRMLSLASNAPLIGSIARLVPQKAPEDLVAACAIVSRAIPEAHFVLIGGGRLAARVDAAIVRDGLGGRFHRIDALAGAAGALGELDVFALSSRFEGGPYSPLEAMRAGTAVVLTDVAGNRDAVENGLSGVLVPPADPGALADAIIRVLRDEALRRRIGEAGRARVLERFDVRRLIARLDDLYQEFAAGAANT